MATRKKQAAPKPAKRRAAVKKAAPPRRSMAVAAMREAAPAAAAREGGLTDADTAILIALDDVSGLVKVSPRPGGGPLLTDPFGTRSMLFDDPGIAVDDGQFALVMKKASTAINDARVDALIQKKLLNPPSAHTVVQDVIDLVQLWIDNPSLTA